MTPSTTIALKDSILFERKLETVTEGLTREYRNLFNILSKEDALTLDYVISLKTEINPSDNYRKSVIKIIGKFMMFCRHSTDVPLVQLGRENVLAFLGSFRKSEDSDPLHKWIGTYNLYRVHLLRFFKWLHHPDIEPNKRPRIIENIPQLKRKEKSIYKPTDMWTAQDDLLFLKYCLSKRMKCFHTMAKDTSSRPHELLKLRIKDVTFKIAPDKSQYAEATVNGKTGNRHLVLIDSIPYVKDYLEHEHPQPGNPNAIFLSGNRKSLGRTIGIKAVENNSEFAKEFGGSWTSDGIAKGFEQLNEIYQNRILSIAETNSEFAEGLGEGLGRKFGEFRDKELQETILQLALRNNEFAKGFGHSLGYRYSSLSDPLQDKILGIAERDKAFAGVLSIDFFWYIRNPLTRDRIWHLAQSNEGFGYKFGGHISQDLDSLKDKNVQARVLDTFQKNTSFASNASWGLAYKFKYFDRHFQSKILDLAEMPNSSFTRELVSILQNDLSSLDEKLQGRILALTEDHTKS